MDDPNTHLTSIEIALINEVTSDNLKDISADGAELALDQFLTDGIIKDIPFFGTLYKGVKTALNIRDSIFAKKVYKFLFELKDIPQEQRLSFVNKLEDNEEYRQKVGEKILMILERVDDMEKAKMVGRLLGVAIEGGISYEEFLRLSVVIQQGFLPYLKKFPSEVKNATSVLMREHFVSLGIMSQTLQDSLTTGLSASEDVVTYFMKVKINYWGDLLLQFAYDGSSFTPPRFLFVK